MVPKFSLSHFTHLHCKDTDDAEFIDEIMNVLGDEVREVDSFLIVYKYKDRFTRPFKRTLTMITKVGPKLSILIVQLDLAHLVL